MRLSKYVKDIKINEEKRMLYSIRTREYYVYPSDEKEIIETLLREVNKGKYTEAEIHILTELIEKKILVTDKEDEIKELEYEENAVKYQNNTFHIMIVVTNACNFRCSYCIQEHENKVLNDVSAQKIIRLLKNVSKDVKKIKVAWFGGEPLIQFERIRRMTEAILEICEENHCELVSSMATNGYLLEKSVVEELKKLKFNLLQITIDGDKASHDSRRYMVSGEGTYDTIIENTKQVLKAGISVILRINIDKDSIDTADEILEKFSTEDRKRMTVQVANLYQENNKISVFPIYEKAIKMGYGYSGRKNIFMACQTCLKNGMIVNTDGNIIICSNAEGKKELGYIDADGKIHIKDVEKYHALKTLSAIQNPECRECIELPFCIGSCKYRRSQENTKCIGKKSDGLSIEEYALLDYIYDKNQEEK